jgi:hypothetical protein
MTVLQGQTALVRPRIRELGAAVRISVDPPAATIDLGASPVGSGTWEGRLPPDSYRVVFREDGYVTETRTLRVDASTSAPVSLSVRLAADPAHPRWPKRSAGYVELELFGGLSLASGLHGSAERDCPAACSRSHAAYGGFVGLRAGLRALGGLGGEVAFGFMTLEATIQRSRNTTFPGLDGQARHAIRYELVDPVRLRGPFAAVSASQRVRLGPVLALTGRATVGALFGSAADPLEGTAFAGGARSPVHVSGASESASSNVLFVAPELGLSARYRSFFFSAALSVAFFPMEGPTLEHAELGIRPNCGPGADPASVGCARNSSLVANERAHGSFVLWMPQLAAGYAF